MERVDLSVLAGIRNLRERTDYGVCLRSNSPVEIAKFRDVLVRCMNDDDQIVGDLKSRTRDGRRRKTRRSVGLNACGEGISENSSAIGQRTGNAEKIRTRRKEQGDRGACASRDILHDDRIHL